MKSTLDKTLIALSAGKMIIKKLIEKDMKLNKS